MSSDTEVAVFIDTNLGTHLAMAVSPDATIGDFQGKLETTHNSCFPKLGKIEVYALMVKRKSCFYHLPSSMPVKYAFQHQEGTWFLRIEARTLKGSDGSCLANFAAAEVGDRKCDGNRLTNLLVQKNIQGEAVISSDAAERNLSSMTKNPTDNSSRAISSSGIVSENLLNWDCSGVRKHANFPTTTGAILGLPEEELRTKVDNYCSSIRIGGSPPFTVRTPPKQSSIWSPGDRSTGTRRDKFMSGEVGKRIMIASNNMRISASKQRPANALSRLRLRYKSVAKFLVFEISDNED